MLVYQVTRSGENTGRLYLFHVNERHFSKERIELTGMLTRALAIEEERMAYEQDPRGFVAIASHELRHPITVIKGYAMTLEKHMAELDEQSSLEIFHNIDRSADRLTKLVTELLDTSNIDRGHSEERPTSGRSSTGP